MVHMDLHRHTGKPDWELVPESDRTPVQRLAAKTNGWLTPANAVTFASNISSFAGLYYLSRDKTKLGLLCLAIGRCGDGLDGIVAQYYGVKSPLGEALDAGFDKLQAAVALGIGMTRGSIPYQAGVPLATEQTAITAISAVANWGGKKVHPGASGKLATAAMWLGMAEFVAADIVAPHSSTHAEQLKFSAYATSWLSLGLGVHAIGGYINDARCIPGSSNP